MKSTTTNTTLKVSEAEEIILRAAQNIANELHSRALNGVFRSDVATSTVLAAGRIQTRCDHAAAAISGLLAALELNGHLDSDTTDDDTPQAA